jgi:hypothetical protein
MSFRKGHRVRFKVSEYHQREKDDLADPSTKRMMEELHGIFPDSPRKEMEKRISEDPKVEATITGFSDYGDWAHLLFDDGFECGCSSELLELAPK